MKMRHTSSSLIGFASLIAMVFLIMGIALLTMPEFSAYAKRVVGPNSYWQSASEPERKINIATPAFSMRDAAGEQHVFVVNLRFDAVHEAAAVCRWMPVLVDRIYRVVLGADLAPKSEGEPPLFLEKRRISVALGQIHDSLRPVKIEFVNLSNPSPDKKKRLALAAEPPFQCRGEYIDFRKSQLYFG